MLGEIYLLRKSFRLKRTGFDAEIADLEAERKMKRDVRDDKYSALDQKRSKIGRNVAADPAYGNDSPLYGAMGFVRKSDRASGLML